MTQFEPSYNLFLVSLSFFVSIFGSYTGILLVKAAQSSEKNRHTWIAASAVALGAGAIWTMHFIGMLAYDMGMPVNYDPLVTFASLAIAVIVVGIGLFFVAGNQQSIPRLLIAGVITGLGVASMHFSGMYAMNMSEAMTYDRDLVSASIAIALVAATAALWLAFNLEGNMKMLMAAVVMGLAVCGMHYVGMAAMTMGPMEHAPLADEGIKPLTLGLFIFCFSMLLLVLCLIAGMAQLSRKMYEQMEREDAEDDALDGVKGSYLNLSAGKVS